MKKISSLILIITILILSFDLINANIELLLKFNKKIISDSNVFVADKSLNNLKKLKARIDSLGAFKVSIDKKSILIEQLIKKYDFKNSSDYINDVELPNIMRINILTNKVNNEKYKAFQKILLSAKSKVNFENKGLPKIIGKTDKIKKIRPFIFLLEGLGGLFILFFMQEFLEKRERKYWDIYYSVGGEKKSRIIKFIRQFLIILIFTIFIGSIVENYIAKIYNLQISKLILESQIGILSISNLWIYLIIIKRGNK